MADFVGEELFEPCPGVGVEHFLDSSWVNVLQPHTGDVGRRAEVKKRHLRPFLAGGVGGVSGSGAGRDDRAGLELPLAECKSTQNPPPMASSILSPPLFLGGTGTGTPVGVSGGVAGGAAGGGVDGPQSLPSQ